MKLYIAAGTYYEKQADVPKGTKFEAVEFPFAASPKADFVDWMNGFSGMAQAAPEEPNLLAPVVALAQAAPAQPSPAHADQMLAFEDEWAAFPLTRKLHFAALACEDAREAIRP